MPPPGTEIVVVGVGGLLLLELRLSENLLPSVTAQLWREQRQVVG
jgi:hypothetical protein